MKVLQVNAVCGIKSTGRTASELADHLEKHGHKAIIVYGENKDKIGFCKCKNVYFMGNIWDHKIHALLSRITGYFGNFSSLQTKKLLNYVSIEKPDVVHLRNLHANYINIPMLLDYLSEFDIPTVITLHDSFMYTGGCSYYYFNKCYKWVSNCGNCEYRKDCMPSYFFDRSSELFNQKRQAYMRFTKLAVIGVSDWITNEAKKSILNNAKIIRRIYNWVDLNIFKPTPTREIRAELEIENKFVILGVATKWTSKKGLNVFFRLAKNLPEGYVICLVGALQSLKLPKNIININEITNEYKMAEIYSMADVFLQLSKEETFGKVLAESLACGTPSVAYGVTATPELLGFNCGFLINNLDVCEIIENIEKIKNNKSINFSFYCREYAENNFNKDLNIESYIKVYRNLIENE